MVDPSVRSARKQLLHFWRVFTRLFLLFPTLVSQIPNRKISVQTLEIQIFHRTTQESMTVADPRLQRAWSQN